MIDFELPMTTATLLGQPWAILPEKLEEICSVLSRRKDGLTLTAPPVDMAEERRRARVTRAAVIGARLRDVGGMLVDQVGKVAVLPMFGTISQRPSVFAKYSGGTSAEQFAAAHLALVDDPGVSAVVWDVESPGGSVAGVPEAAARLMQVRGQKKTVAISNTMMASAAYWLGSAADQVVAAPSSLTGSIGVVAAHEDYSRANEKAGVAVTYVHAGKYKVEGNPDQPLSAEGAQAIQQTVDDFYGQFVSAVARARNVSTSKVRTGYGEGRVLTAKRAVEAGLADKVETLPQLLQRLGAYSGRSDLSASAPTSMRAALRRQRQAEADLTIRQR